MSGRILCRTGVRLRYRITGKTICFNRCWRGGRNRNSSERFGFNVERHVRRHCAAVFSFVVFLARFTHPGFGVRLRPGVVQPPASHNIETKGFGWVSVSWVSCLGRFPLLYTAGGPVSDTKSPLTAKAPIMYLSPAALSSDATCADTLPLRHQSTAGATRFQEKPREARPPAQFRMNLPQTDNHHWGSYRVLAPSSRLRRTRTSTEPQMRADRRWGSNLTRRIASRPQRLPLAPARAQLGLEPVPPDSKPAQWAGAAGA